MPPQKAFSVTRAQPIFEVDSYDDGAILRACGFAIRGSRVNPRSGRGVLVFADPDKKADAVLGEHAAGRLQRSTLDVIEALRAVKSRIFDIRRREGLDRPQGPRR